ncbi:MAG: M20/M25/M40 family metallo-hydrolase [Deltaproteobacteria bacterium]|nr:M20/M25/M40 family metallo-hydrolase [Deltaproteobacteria bacterium]
MNELDMLINGTVKSVLFNKVYEDIQKNIEPIIEEIKTISTIPSPTFYEDKKADYIKGKFNDLKLDDVKIDRLKNVIGTLQGKGDENFIICAHIDTVFSNETKLKVREVEGKIFCPGIGDNSTSVAGMLALINAFKTAEYIPPYNIIFIANSCEEGLGDLKGIKYYLENSDKIEGMISIDGTMTMLSNEGIGSRRLSVTVKGEGGHSWVDFGNSSAIHAIGSAISKISQIDVPKIPKTSFNVGTISGGTSVNTIAETANMLIDIRSVDSEILIEKEQEIRELIENAMEEHGTECSIEVVGDRPSGKIDINNFVVQSVLKSAELYDVQMKPTPSSTDSNIPLSQSIPSVTFGIYSGGGAHTLNEYIEPESLKKGLPILALSVLTILDQISGTSKEFP